MFYSSEILNIKSNSNLGIVWLAATLGPKSNAKRLARKDLASISITSTCSFLIAPPEPLSLRLSANLMVGVTRVYGQQCQFHWSDVQGLCTKISHINKPVNPEDIDLPNHEKKGNNITLKKIDCISAVNTLPGDPLNFPDLDISNLLLMSTESGATGRSSETSMNPEMGRKSFASALGTPFSTTSGSSNALQGSDFAAAISDSDLAYSLNDYDMMHGSDYSMNSNEILPLRPKTIGSSDNLEFQVPNHVEKRRISRVRRIKNSLMDMELMLGKDELFIKESELLPISQNNSGTEEIDPIHEALKLLNGPDECFATETFDGIFKTSKLNFKLSVKQQNGKDSSAFTSDQINFNDAEYYNDNDVYNNDDIEQYRNVPNSTPSTLNLPWSTSGSSVSDSISSMKGFSSIGINTPIRKGQQSSPSSISDLQDLRLSSSSGGSSSSIPLYNPQNNMNLSQETFDFLYFIHDSMTSDSGITTFGSVLNKEIVSRPIAARAFHHLLELKSANLIDVKQPKPFSDIQIIIK